MYCSSCGVAVTQGLSYCNYCGAKLVGAGGSDPQTPEVRPELLVSAMAGVFILGVAVITVLMGVMKSVLNFDVPLIIAFTLLSFLIMLSLEGVFLRLLFRRRRGQEEPVEAVLSKGPTTKELDAAQTRGLDEAVPSVTENTTRALQPVYTKPTSK